MTAGGAKMASTLKEAGVQPRSAGASTPVRPRKSTPSRPRAAGPARPLKPAPVLASAPAPVVVPEPSSAPVASAEKRPARRVSVGTFLAFAAAVLTVGAGVIHFAFAPDHIAEYLPFGIAFYAMGVAQVAGGLAVAIFRRSRPLFLAVVVGSLGICALWLVTRTVGLPIGAELWHPEKVGVADTVCVAFQLATAGLLGSILPRRGAFSRLWESHLGWRTAAVALTALAIVVAPRSLHASHTGHEMSASADMPAKG